MSLLGSRDELLILEDEIEEESVEEEEGIRPEDFLNKNTSSFQCLAQVAISRSSLLLDPYYWFPELTDPKLDAFLAAEEPKTVYDKLGRIKYLEMCRQLNVQPYRRVLNSLENHFMDLSYFGLNSLEIRALCEALAMNKYIGKLSLEENFLTPESVKFIDAMLLKNSTIRQLDLKNCNIGPEGAKNIRYGFAFNKSVEELNLSNNNLEDEGVLYVAKAMAKNNCVEILNLSHNKLGIDALKYLADMIIENYTLMDLILSWNQLYMDAGMTEFMAALLDNMQLQRLDLSWCGIGDKDNMRPIYNYIRSDQAHLLDLDLSNNRIGGMSVTMLKTGLKFNEKLALINLSSNPMTPAEVEFLCGVVYEPRGDTPCPLKLLDFSNIMVDKTFMRVRNKCQKLGVQIKYEGILSNFKVNLPSIKPILCHRAKFVAMNQKKKKFRQDFGIFLLRLPAEKIGRTEFGEYMEKYKIKLDNDLIEGLLRTFANKEGEFQLPMLIEEYMKHYPETALPPVIKKKGKKRKPKLARSEATTISEQTEYTDYTYMSSAISEKIEAEMEEGEIEEGEEEEDYGGSIGPVTLGSGQIGSHPDSETITSDLFKSVLEGADQSEATTLA